MLDAAAAAVVVAAAAVVVVATDPSRRRYQVQDRRKADRLWVRTGSESASEIGLYQAAESYWPTATFRAGILDP